MRRAGKGNFNNAFKVADDIRLLGAVPEEDEENREVSVDKHMAQAMEERLLRGFEQEMIRDRQAMIKSIMRDGTGACPSPPAACCAACYDDCFAVDTTLAFSSCVSCAVVICVVCSNVCCVLCAMTFGLPQRVGCF